VDPIPIEPEPILPTRDNLTIARAGTAASAVNAQPGVTRLTLMIVGAAGALAGIVLVVALSSLRGDAPLQTASAASSAAAATRTPPAAPAPTVVESAPAPTWTGQREAAWAHDGSKTITFELQAVHDVPVWASRARPVLVVRCLSRATNTFVVLGTSTKFEDDTLRRTIRVQWDDGPATVQQWEVSDSAHELFAPDGVAFVRQLAKANHLRFGFTPFNAQPVTAEFVVQGFNQLAGLIANTCGWRL
jgi:hypothetical protein